MLRNYFITTIRTLRQNPLYTALSVLGIAFTFVFVCVIFLMAKHLKVDFIPPKYAERTWQVRSIDIGNGQSRQIRKEQYETWIPKMKTPEITMVVCGDAGVVVSANDKNAALIFNCISENYFDVCKFKFLSGRPISKQEIAEGIPVVVIDRHARGKLFAKSEDPTGKNVEILGVQYRIVGVIENVSVLASNVNISRANIFVPLKAAEYIQKDRGTNAIVFTAKDKASVAEVQAEFTRVINETNVAEGAQYSIRESRRETIEQGYKFINMFAIFGSLILMLIPAVNILSLNVSKSYDRSEEIAIRKAFGAPLYTIFTQLLFENILLTLSGAIIGMCITPPLLQAIDRLILGKSLIPLTFSLSFDWATVFMVAVPCVLIFSFLSGSIPAYITAKRDIVNVLKGEAQ